MLVIKFHPGDGRWIAREGAAESERLQIALVDVTAHDAGDRVEGGVRVHREVRLALLRLNGWELLLREGHRFRAGELGTVEVTRIMRGDVDTVRLTFDCPGAVISRRDGSAPERLPTTGRAA